MLRRLSETDLLRIEFADFCHARGNREYDFACYYTCAVLQFKGARLGKLTVAQLFDLYDYARVRPWNFRALAKRLAVAEGQRE